MTEENGAKGKGVNGILNGAIGPWLRLGAVLLTMGIVWGELTSSVKELRRMIGDQKELRNEKIEAHNRDFDAHPRPFSRIDNNSDNIQELKLEFNGFGAKLDEMNRKLDRALVNGAGR